MFELLFVISFTLGGSFNEGNVSVLLLQLLVVFEVELVVLMAVLLMLLLLAFVLLLGICCFC